VLISLSSSSTTISASPVEAKATSYAATAVHAASTSRVLSHPSTSTKFQKICGFAKCARLGRWVSPSIVLYRESRASTLTSASSFLQLLVCVLNACSVFRVRLRDPQKVSSDRSSRKSMSRTRRCSSCRRPFDSTSRTARHIFLFCKN
jgi:hypothetical protein